MELADPSVQKDLHCPMCVYNLRGLIEPRCPECGFQFTWAELVDAEKNKHPYLFEHHPERNIWSYWKTFWRDGTPGQFWTDLHPAQPIRVRRLLIYWTFSILLLLLPALYSAIDVGRALYNSRINYLATLTPLPNGDFSQVMRNPNWTMFTPASRIAVTPQTITIVIFRSDVDRWEPSIFTLAGLERIALTALEPYLRRGFWQLLLWPWLTLAALFVFQTSLRRTKIRQVHLLRCVIYCCWFPMIFILIGWFVSNRNYPSLWVMTACMVFSLIRLSVAYRQYLRFSHAFLTVLASQVMVILVVLIIMLFTPDSRQLFDGLHSLRFLLR